MSTTCETQSDDVSKTFFCSCDSELLMQYSQYSLAIQVGLVALISVSLESVQHEQLTVVSYNA